MKERLASVFKSPNARVVVERVNATYKARGLWTDAAKQVHTTFPVKYVCVVCCVSTAVAPGNF